MQPNSKYSYAKDVSVQEDQLNKYLLQDNQQNIDQNQINHSAQELKQQQKSIISFYIGFLIIAQIFGSIIAVFCLISIPYMTMRYVAYSMMSVASFLLAFLVSSGVQKKHINLYWWIFWMQYALCLVASIFILQKKDDFNCFWLFLASSIVLGIAELIFKRALKYYLLALCVNVPLTGILYTYTNQNEGDPSPKMSFIIFISPALLLLVGAILVTRYTYKKWRKQKSKNKIFILCLYYGLLVLLVSCVAGFVTEWISFPWPYITVLNHLFFIFVLLYVSQLFYPKLRELRIFRFFLQQKKQKSIIQDEQGQILFLVSNGLLCRKQDYVQGNSKSIFGKPVQQCICCLNEQSSFCYANCKHLLIGLACVIDWLKRKQTKCPMCRTESDLMLRIKRVGDVQFQIIGKYKLTD